MSELSENGNGPENNGKVNTFEERGFCAFVDKHGVTRSLVATRIEAFRGILAEADVAWVDYMLLDFMNESIEVARALGFSELLVKNLVKNERSGYEDFETEMGLLLPAMDVDEFDVKLKPLLILIKKNVVVTLHTTETSRFFRVRRYAETLLKKLPHQAQQKDRITILLSRIIEENNAKNFDHLREIEEQGDQMSRELSDPKTPRDVIGPKIYKMKHALIVYLGGLWATIDALNALRYGDAELMTDDTKIIHRLKGLVSEVGTQIGLAEHLSEVLASGLEVLQSIYNNQLQILNNRLALMVAYLTIIGTALLVPNTIATVAGNSMFGFTQNDVGWYLSLIVISTVFATILAWFVVKKLGLLPSSPE
jgi:magnesium transporter